MKITVEMENKKIYNINYPDSLELFEQTVQFSEGNAFLQTDEGTRISIKKIVEYKPENV